MADTHLSRLIWIGRSKFYKKKIQKKFRKKKWNLKN